MNWPAVSWTRVPAISSAMLRRADAAALEQFNIEPMQLMEVAGWQVARFVDAFLHGIWEKRVTVVAGAGNNGGDALVAARFLHQRGARVTLGLVSSRDSQSLAAHHALTMRRMGIPSMEAPAGITTDCEVIVDGLLGTGIRPPLRPPAPAMIAAMNATGLPIVAIDVPSGMDADTAIGQDQAVKAVATVTLAAPKPGLAIAGNVGRVFVADIGLPAALFGAAAESVRRLFSDGDLIELVQSGITPG